MSYRGVSSQAVVLHMDVFVKRFVSNFHMYELKVFNLNWNWTKLDIYPVHFNHSRKIWFQCESIHPNIILSALYIWSLFTVSRPSLQSILTLIPTVKSTYSSFNLNMHGFVGGTQKVEMGSACKLYKEGQLLRPWGRTRSYKYNKSCSVNGTFNKHLSLKNFNLLDWRQERARCQHEGSDGSEFSSVLDGWRMDLCVLTQQLEHVTASRVVSDICCTKTDAIYTSRAQIISLSLFAFSFVFLYFCTNLEKVFCCSFDKSVGHEGWRWIYLFYAPALKFIHCLRQ